MPETSANAAKLGLSMHGVHKHFGATQALAGVDFDVAPGEVHALVGENGAGKSTLMKVLSGAHTPDRGNMLLDGKPYKPRNPLDARRRGVAMIYQEPMASLNPAMRIGDQLAETLHHQLGLEWGAARQRSIEWLDRVRLPDPERTANQYPHQISGGMQQRVGLARALAANPDLLVRLARGEMLFDSRKREHARIGDPLTS